MYRSVLLTLATVLALAVCPAAGGGQDAQVAKLDPSLRVRTRTGDVVRVVVHASDLSKVEADVAAWGGRLGRRLTAIDAVVAEIPDGALDALARNPSVRRLSLDRRLHGTLDVTAAAVGARAATEQLGLDGRGIGVATIDSGVYAAHADLGAGRVVHFFDFVAGRSQAYDGYGHGTHVAGVIAGNGHHSGGARKGIAPGAHLVVLKALDEHGGGYISHAIAAIDYAIEHRATYNIRVINLSVAAGVYESYRTDPLTLAAARAVDAGIVVVTAAGNLGRNDKGQPQQGGITAPGNAPWVLTVGAASHNGTVDRRDDTVAPFSSRGPSAIDFVSKPDLVAPGVGIESLADPGGALFAARPDARLWGTLGGTVEPYLSLSGTSMASPVVAGTVALMLQANPSLTPQGVKALLKASADAVPGQGAVAQGAGLLNARAAVELARALADMPAAATPLEDFIAAFGPEEGAWTPLCDPADAACAQATVDCSATRACFSDLADSIVGVHAPAETIGTNPGAF